MDYKEIPALAPPPGVKYNFDNPDTLRGSLIAVNATFLPLMMLAVAIRIYTRGCISKALGWDDLTCALAAIGSVVSTIMLSLDIHHGYGVHLWDIRVITLTPSYVRELLANGITYPINSFCIKLSISLLYFRLFTVHRTFRIFLYVGIAFCSVWYPAWTGLEIAITVLCNDKHAITYALCRNASAQVVFSSVINFLTDVYLLALPIPVLIGLHLQHRRKLGLLTIFLAGSLACAVSLARLILVSVRFKDTDGYYYAALASEFNTVEVNVGIITASMPTMPRFFSDSTIFSKSTYSSVCSRMFGPRTRTETSAAEDRSQKLGAEKRSGTDRASMQDKGYIELREAQQVSFTNGEGV